MEPQCVARSGHKSAKRIGEITNARRLIYRHRGRVGHSAQVDGVGMIDSPAAGEVQIGHERAHRRPTGVDLESAGHGLGGCGCLVGGRARAARANGLHQIEEGCGRGEPAV